MSADKQPNQVIEQLLVSPIPEIVDLTQQAVALRTKLLEGKITSNEFDELFDNLQQLSHINENMIEVERWREIVEAVKILNIIRQWAPLL